MQVLEVQYKFQFQLNQITSKSKSTRLQSKSYMIPPCPWSALRHLQGGSHQRSLSNRLRRAYLLKPSERQVCGFWEVTKPTRQNNRKSNFLTVDTILTIIGPSDPQVRHHLRPRHVPTDRVSTQLSLHVNYLQLTRSLSAHPQLSFNVCDFTCQHKFQPLRLHMPACYRPAD